MSTAELAPDFYLTCNREFLGSLDDRGRQLLKEGRLNDFGLQYPEKLAEFMKEVNAYTMCSAIVAVANEQAELASRGAK